MIASRAGEAVAVHRARNAAASPLRYIFDPQQQYDLETAIEEEGLELGAIYHSHTRTAPKPSQTDINLARFAGTDEPAFPGTLYVIIGVEDRNNPEIRAFSIIGDDVTEAQLEVV